MGTWGTKIFQDDAALDARDEFLELVGAGCEVSEATDRVRARDPEPMTLVALALTQSKVGRLLPDVRDEAIRVLDAGGDLAAWDEAQREKRSRELQRAREVLSSAQRTPARIAPLVLNSSPFSVGDLVSYTTDSGRTAAFWVIDNVRYERHVGVEVTPALQLIALGKPGLPSVEAMTRGIPARVREWNRFQQVQVADGANAVGERWDTLGNAHSSQARFRALGESAHGFSVMEVKKPRGKRMHDLWIDNRVDFWFDNCSDLLDVDTVLEEAESLLKAIEAASVGEPEGWSASQLGEFTTFLQNVAATLRSHERLTSSDRTQWVAMTGRWGTIRPGPSTLLRSMEAQAAKFPLDHPGRQLIKESMRRLDAPGAHISETPPGELWEHVRLFDRDFFDFVRWDSAEEETQTEDA